jgi:hypothetical protein
MPPCIIAMLRQHGQPPAARWPCDGVLGSAIGSVAARWPMPHIMPPPAVVALAPVVLGEPPHIWAAAGAAQARARTVAVRARVLRMAHSSVTARS